MQVALSFGPYPTNVQFGTPGALNCDDLGLIWLKHVALFSRPGMLFNHSLILLVPKETVIPEDCHLEKWGSVKRFAENSKVEQWPLGPNLIFEQIIWLQYNNKLSVRSSGANPIACRSCPIGWNASTRNTAIAVKHSWARTSSNR